MKPFKLLLYKYALVVVIISTSAADWPKFGGMHGTFVSVDDGIIKNWSDEEPQRLWKIDVGLGFSSVVEANGFAYTQGYKNGKNTLFCVDVKVKMLFGKRISLVILEIIFSREEAEQHQPLMTGGYFYCFIMVDYTVSML